MGYLLPGGEDLEKGKLKEYTACCEKFIRAENITPKSQAEFSLTLKIFSLFGFYSDAKLVGYTGYNVLKAHKKILKVLDLTSKTQCL